ncbi:uncharacterized protein ELE39_001501 [Cryptosporidium sp. chipmunk genotype I]|uniref:uncharacterized protein n=1 Tax=Cryptosporidium sp. chipmunk genotype I TaxID=1280935 RepID=UPI00351A7AA0|nr:hypothetical protein ELE39_001501 [Cryptosporidium sp. chipmunk genotype I]
MTRLSLHPRRFESEYSVETDKYGEENVSNLNKNSRSGRKIQKSILPNKRRSISIGSGESDDPGTIRLLRTSINLKGQIDQSKSFFSKNSSNQLQNEELDQLCNQCLNLLRQNKISSKNAFDILLIDHLNDIVNVQDSQGDNSSIITRESKKSSSKLSNSLEENNKNIDKFKMNEAESYNEIIGSEITSQDSIFQKFQRAAVTLEASARIYGYRVDSTFDNAYRILSSIKSGQILAKNDSDCEEEEQQEGNGSSEDTLEEGESNRKKKHKRNLIFSGENNTIVNNPESITLKEFEKTKEITEKPFFVNFLNDKVKLDNIRFGVDFSNIGSISSMLMNNLELKDSVCNRGKSALLSFNISGRNGLINRNNFLSSRLGQDQLLMVNKTTLDLLLPSPSESFSKDVTNTVCPDLSKILDSIREITEKHSDIKQVKNSIFIEEYQLSKQENKKFLEFSEPSFEKEYAESEDNFLKKHSKSMDNIKYGNEEQGPLDFNSFGGEEHGEVDIGLQDFQIHVEKVIKDLSKNEFSEQILEKGLNQSQEIETTKKSGEFKFSKIGDVLDFLASKSTRNLEFFSKRRKGEKNNSIFTQKLKSKLEHVDFEIPSLLLTNNIFNGIEWINSLPKTKQTQENTSRSKTKNFSINKIFVGESNTSSIFNYNLNHLFCLANLTGVKINLRSIHKVERLEEDAGQNCNTNDILIKTSHSQHTNMNILNNSAPEQTDLMANHCEIEDLMQIEGYLQPPNQEEFSMNNYKDISIQSKLLLPFDENKIPDTDVLLEKSSKSLHVRDEYNNSLKFSKSSNHVDIDLVKRALKSSIQILLSGNSNSLTLFNIINQSRKLLQQDGLNSVSTGIFFICILHICNENNYSLSFSDPNINSDSPIELNSENYDYIILNLNSSVDLQK